MKSLVVDQEGKLTIEEVPVPKYGDYQALVKMESCGVCNGTDLKLIHRSFKGFDTFLLLIFRQMQWRRLRRKER